MAAVPPASRRVVFVTSKYWKATSKVGFHFPAHSFARGGWDVVFITTHLNWLATALHPRRPREYRSALDEARRFDRGRVDTAGFGRGTTSRIGSGEARHLEGRRRFF